MNYTYNINGMIPVTGAWAFTASITSDKELTQADIEAMSITDIMNLKDYDVCDECVGIDPDVVTAIIHEFYKE